MRVINRIAWAILVISSVGILGGSIFGAWFVWFSPHSALTLEQRAAILAFGAFICASGWLVSCVVFNKSWGWK